MKLGCIIILCAISFSCTQDVSGIIIDEIPPAAAEELKQEEIQKVPTEDFLTIVAAGDNLFHNELYESSLMEETYQFDSIYEEIKPFVEPADIAFINQETLLAGKDFGYSSYPQFNTPQELGKTLAATGFDVISHANNHVMDKGGKAAIETLNFWNTVPGTEVIGIHASQEARDNRCVIIEKNNIKVGFLAYTCSTNWLPLPKDMPFLVSVADKEIMKKEIDALRPLCDILVVSMHWGDEYQHEPNTEQKTWTSFLAEQNVDIVFGHHPHVLQPYEYIQRADGKMMLCYYSLGNFVSGQDKAPRLFGGMAYIKLKKNDLGTSIEQAEIIPVMTHFTTSWDGFKIYPFHKYTEELLSTHWIKWKEKDINLEYFNQIAKNVFGENVMQYNPFER
jgi:poly-gamma-glutamate synthesis protein (capsule biosynthesis protein)